MADRAPLGFIGTGVMGEPMARNLAQKCGRRVLAWDPDPAPLERLAAAGPACVRHNTWERNFEKTMNEYDALITARSPGESAVRA